MMKFRFSLFLTLICTAAVVTTACTRSQVIRIASSKNPEKTAKRMIVPTKKNYKRDPLALARDVRQLKHNYNVLVRTLRGSVRKKWGQKHTITPSRHRYVKYTNNYLSRAIVNFDTGIIRIETLDTRQPRKSLHQAILTTLLTPNDPRAVDLYSAKQVRLAGTPWLYGLVADQNRHVIRSQPQAEKYSAWLTRQAKTRSISTNGKKSLVTYATMSMVRGHDNIRARRYLPVVSKYAKATGISKNIIFAIMKTESDFNPFAVSSAPAYGLMQLVPHTGGRDAYIRAKKKDWIPSRDYLFNSSNNIELGSTYLNIIYYEYLGRIRNPLSREYCMIAAYNTGSGNVLRTFSPNRNRAFDIINRLKPAAVYWKLKTQLKSAEARRYIRKVMDHRKQFIKF